MKYIALLSLLVFSHLGFAQTIPDSAIKSVDIVIHNQKAGGHMNNSKFVLDVYINGTKKGNFLTNFKVSPGALIDNPKPGKEPELTPEGIFHPTRMYEKYVSKQFGGKFLGVFETGSMPYSIFFHRGFAIHGSASTVDGKPASKGCVRLKKKNARKLYEWVQAAIKNNGGNKKAVRIHIHHTESKATAEYRRKKDPNLKN